MLLIWILLKLYIYGYLNRVQSSRRLERGRETAEHPFGTIKYWMGYTHRNMLLGAVNWLR